MSAPASPLALLPWTGYVRKAVLIWWSMLPIGLLLVLVLPGILPLHYTFDAAMIRDFIVGEDRPTGFAIIEPYANTAYLYILFGVEANAVAGAFFTYFVAWVSVLGAIMLADSGGRLWLWFPAFVWHFLLVIYTCMHTKELHAMPALALVLVLCGRRFTPARIVMITSAIIAYALYFRLYWAVAALLAFAFIWLRRRIPASWKLALLMFAAYIMLFVGYHLATGKFITDFRAALTAGRELDLFSDTAFPNRFANETLLDDVLNAMYAFVRLMIPLPLMATGKVQHLAFALWEVASVALFALLFARVWRVPNLDARTEFSAAWILAFSLTQGLFEPDYGTFLRHQTNLFPALALLTLNAVWVVAPRRRVARKRSDEPAQAAV